MNYFRLPQVVVFAFSFVTSTIGLSTVVEWEPTFEVMGWSVNPVVLVLVLVGTLIGFASIETARHRLKSSSKKIASYILYVVYMIASVFAAYGFYWSIMEFNSYAEERYTVIVSDVDLQIQTITENTSALIAASLELRERSSEKREQEVAVGSSCDGSNSGAGDGPFSRERNAITNIMRDETTSFEGNLSRAVAGFEERVKVLRDKIENEAAGLDANALQALLVATNDSINGEISQLNNQIFQFRASFDANLEKIGSAIRPPQPGLAPEDQTNQSILGEQKCDDAELFQVTENLRTDLSEFTAITYVQLPDDLATRSPVVTAVRSLFDKTLSLFGFTSTGSSEIAISGPAILVATIVDGLALIFSLAIPRGLFKNGIDRWIAEYVPSHLHEALKALTTNFTFSTLDEQFVMLPGLSADSGETAPIRAGARRRKPQVGPSQKDLTLALNVLIKSRLISKKPLAGGTRQQSIRTELVTQAQEQLRKQRVPAAENTAQQAKFHQVKDVSSWKALTDYFG